VPDAAADVDVPVAAADADSGGDVIVAGRHGRDAREYHFVRAGGGKTRSSICGKEVGPVNAWRLGHGSLKACAECVTIARRKHGLEPPV
jgi:hypothetical protein